MAVQDDLIEALNNCIDRLSAGEDLEAILDNYPALANQLRPMLEAGLLLPRARYPTAEVERAEQTLEPVMRQTIQQIFRGGLSRIWWILLLLLLLSTGLGAFILVPNRASESLADVVQITATPTHTPVLTITSTQTSTAVATSTPLPTQTQEVQVVITAAVTSTPSAIPSITPSPTAIAEPLIVIEGPVTAINANMITIYQFNIQLNPTDAMISVIQIGDVIRIEGQSSDDTVIIQAVTITFINVAVVVNENQAWRGDNCRVPPPSWAQAETRDWNAACRPASSGSSGSSDGSSSSNNDNDDDGDDDDD